MSIPFRKGFLICGIGLVWECLYPFFLLFSRSQSIYFGIAMYMDQKIENRGYGLIESHWESSF